MATRPATGGALRHSNRLAALFAILLAFAIGSMPVATLVALGTQTEARP